MIKRPFFGLIQARLKYPAVIPDQPVAIKDIDLSSRIVLLYENKTGQQNVSRLKAGDKVKTGQRLELFENTSDYIISTATGEVNEISKHTGYFGRNYISITIARNSKDQWDENFKTSDQAGNYENVIKFLGALPGETSLSILLSLNPAEHPPINKIVIKGIDNDLLVTNNQTILKTQLDDLKNGIAILSEIMHTKDIIFVVPPALETQVSELEVTVKTVEPKYPNHLPHMIMKNVLGEVIPAGKSLRDSKADFINAEAVAALGMAFRDRVIPIYKILTVIKKDSSVVMVRTRVGTPVKDILDTLGIELNHGDRLVLGGPMTGHVVYSEDLPVMYDTDAIMIQDKKQIILSTDNQCINCGECIRACPAKVPVNMLVRVLENGLYDDAADEYGLFSCIECGLCAYVCTARIPVFHFIMLGKHEYALLKNAEESNA